RNDPEAHATLARRLHQRLGAAAHAPRHEIQRFSLHPSLDKRTHIGFTGAAGSARPRDLVRIEITGLTLLPAALLLRASVRREESERPDALPRRRTLRTQDAPEHGAPNGSLTVQGTVQVEQKRSRAQWVARD